MLLPGAHFWVMAAVWGQAKQHTGLGAGGWLTGEGIQLGGTTGVQGQNAVGAPSQVGCEAGNELLLSLGREREEAGLDTAVQGE